MAASKRDPEFIVSIVGDLGCGKTTLTNALEKKPFPSKYKATLGVELINTTILTEPLELWDIAGQERFGNLHSAYFKNKSAVVICYDATRKSTYEDVTKWHDKIKMINPDVPIMLLCLKFDLVAEQDKESCKKALTTKAKEINATHYFAVSAKDYESVLASFEALTKTLLELKKATPRTEKMNTQLLRIYNALYEGELTLFKKGHAWKESMETTGSPFVLSKAMDTHAEKDYSRTATAKRLNDEFPNWDNPSSDLHDDHKLKMIVGCYKASNAKSGWFRKTAKIELMSLADILFKADKKQDSRTGKIVRALKIA